MRTKSICLFLVLSVAAIAVVMIAVGRREHRGTTPTGAEAYHGLIDYRAKDAKPAIFDPQFVPAAEAHLAGGTSVIGVSVGGQSRAYPLYVLNNHQIVNDSVGGKSIACSW